MLKLNYKNTDLYRTALELERLTRLALPVTDRVDKDFHLHALMINAAVGVKANIAKSLYFTDVELKKQHIDAALNCIIDLDAAGELYKQIESGVFDGLIEKFERALDACFAEIMKHVIALKSK